MANPEHVKILKQGGEVWNRWRVENPEVSPDLSRTNFSKKKSGEIALLSDANLKNANLNEADFSGADFSKANFSDAKLSGANLSGAKFKKADLGRADFSGANLSGANIYRANLSGANFSGADLSGADLYATSRDYWKIDGVKCDYVYWSRDRKTRTPGNRNFRPGEFQDLYKWKPLDDFNNLITRSIKFPEEYKQAGSSILNYFSEILRKKYPDINATVQIKQDDLKVTMIIDPVDGDRKVIEKALGDYGLVVTGNMKPEEFTDDRLLLIELKTELRMAQVRIETQKELLQDKSAQINKLLSIVGQAVQAKPTVIVGDTTTIEGRDVNFAKDQGRANNITGSQE